MRCVRWAAWLSSASETRWGSSSGEARARARLVANDPSSLSASAPPGHAGTSKHGRLLLCYSIARLLESEYIAPGPISYPWAPCAWQCLLVCDRTSRARLSPPPHEHHCTTQTQQDSTDASQPSRSIGTPHDIDRRTKRKKLDALAARHCPLYRPDNTHTRGARRAPDTVQHAPSFTEHLRRVSEKLTATHEGAPPNMSTRRKPSSRDVGIHTPAKRTELLDKNTKAGPAGRGSGEVGNLLTEPPETSKDTPETAGEHPCYKTRTRSSTRLQLPCLYLSPCCPYPRAPA